MQSERTIGTEEVLFTAKDLQRLRWQTGRKPGIDPPGATIICLQAESAKRRYHPKEIKGLFGDCQLINSRPTHIALAGGFGTGAPASGIVVEEHVSFGVRRFVSIGIAGSLQPHLQTGDVVVCDQALRGEGIFTVDMEAAALCAVAKSLDVQTLDRIFCLPFQSLSA